jgi:hypothetical protein
LLHRLWAEIVLSRHHAKGPDGAIAWANSDLRLWGKGAKLDGAFEMAKAFLGPLSPDRDKCLAKRSVEHLAVDALINMLEFICVEATPPLPPEHRRVPARVLQEARRVRNEEFGHSDQHGFQMDPLEAQRCVESLTDVLRHFYTGDLDIRFERMRAEGVLSMERLVQQIDVISFDAENVAAAKAEVLEVTVAIHFGTLCLLRFYLPRMR